MINISKYAKALGKKESNNNYKATNSIGALGYYQFMPATLNSLQSLYHIDPWINADYFLSNPSLQELYFDKHILDSQSSIRNYGLSKYYGTTVKGTGNAYKMIVAPLNEYGVLAAMHLGGPGNVKKYLENGIDRNDGATWLSDYAAYFSKLFDGGTNVGTTTASLIGGGGIILPIAFMLGIVLYLYQQNN
jgi:hypothetical protein